MKIELKSFRLPKEVNILFIIAPAALLFISIIFYFKESYVAFAIFTVLTILLLISSTYKKSIFFDAQLNTLSLEKAYIGIVISVITLKITPDSQLRLFSEKHVGKSSMGYTDVSHFLTLAFTGQSQNGTMIEEKLCAEHREKEKEEFLLLAKQISGAIDVQLSES